MLFPIIQQNVLLEWHGVTKMRFDIRKNVFLCLYNFYDTISLHAMNKYFWWGYLSRDASPMKHLSQRSLIKHTCSWRKKLLLSQTGLSCFPINVTCVVLLLFISLSISFSNCRIFMTFKGNVQFIFVCNPKNNPLISAFHTQGLGTSQSVCRDKK